jgi:hypothetical protein
MDNNNLELKNKETQVNNLFLIGAGFTKAVFPDAPLNEDLLSVLCKGTQCTTLKRYYRERKTNDIEILLTYLDLEILRPTHKQQALQQVRKDIEQQLAKYFEQFRFKEEVLKENNWLEFFTKSFNRNDAIITLNYDCLLEGVLDYYGVWSPKGGYAVLDNNPLLGSEFPQNERNIRIFKIHGSEHFIEASGIPNREKTAIDFPVYESIYPRSGKNRHFNYGMGQEIRPYIIAPSFVKIPHEDIELMMIKALKAAASANNFIVIGCSLRPEDSFLWLLMTSFLNQPPANRKVVIVDPCAEMIAKKVVGHYFVDINRFVRIKKLANILQDIVKELINELHESRIQKWQEKGE